MYKVYLQTDLTDEELRKLGLKGHWFVERDDGQVWEFETETAAREFVDQRLLKERST